MFHYINDVNIKKFHTNLTVSLLHGMYYFDGYYIENKMYSLTKGHKAYHFTSTTNENVEANNAIQTKRR